MREVIQQLVAFGPLPAADDAQEEDLAAREALLEAVTKPVSDEEARALVSLFGPDDCFGMAWTVLHLVETAPGWPLRDCLDDRNEWTRRLRERAERGGRAPATPRQK